VKDATARILTGQGEGFGEDVTIVTSGDLDDHGNGTCTFTITAKDKPAAPERAHGDTGFRPQGDTGARPR
jgi:hypothetical protein